MLSEICIHIEQGGADTVVFTDALIVSGVTLIVVAHLVRLIGDLHLLGDIIDIGEDLVHLIREYLEEIKEGEYMGISQYS